MKHTATQSRSLTVEDGPFSLDELAEWIEEAKKSGFAGETTIEFTGGRGSQPTGLTVSQVTSRQPSSATKRSSK